MARNKYGKYFFGWTNFKFIITELILTFTSKESFFSHKRLQTGSAFIIAQFGMLLYLFIKIKTISIYDIILWSSTEFTVAGYVLHKIEKGKRFLKNSKNNLEQNEEIDD